MLLFITVAAATAAAVIVYARLRERSPEVTAATSRQVAEFAAAVVVMATAVQGIIEALTNRSRPLLRSWGGPQRLVDLEDWDE